jgi:BolA family transcriptional regulator, general stress-responsive regulator
MKIANLIADIKQTLSANIADIENISVVDESYKHKKHSGYREGKYHLNLCIQSASLNQLTQIKAHRIIYTALATYIQNDIHALSITLSHDDSSGDN